MSIKKLYNCKSLIPVVILLFTAGIAYPLIGIKDKKRQETFKLYSAQEYDSALPLLRSFVFPDSSVLYIMDYFMLADIYVRLGMPDSARQVIAQGRRLSESSEDERLLKRNLEFFDSLGVQLKYQTSSLKTPKVKPLESYVEIAVDTTSADSLSAASLAITVPDSAAAPDSLTVVEESSVPDSAIVIPDSLGADDDIEEEKQ